MLCLLGIKKQESRNMSRIGKLPVQLPKGELKQRIDPDIKVNVRDGIIRVERPTDQKRHRALHGLYRALLANMVKGVSEGYEKKLELVGVGFRATVTGQLLEVSVGFSHPVMFALPKEINASAEQLKGQNPIITLTSSDKQLLGQIAAKIRDVRRPEPYKGKGIKYAGEILRRKAGKSAAAAGAAAK